MSQQLVDAKLYELLGDKTAADNEKPSKKKKEKPAKVEVTLFTVVYLIGVTFLSHGLLVIAIPLGFLGYGSTCCYS